MLFKIFLLIFCVVNYAYAQNFGPVPKRVQISGAVRTEPVQHHNFHRQRAALPSRESHPYLKSTINGQTQNINFPSRNAPEPAAINEEPRHFEEPTHFEEPRHLEEPRQHFEEQRNHLEEPRPVTQSPFPIGIGAENIGRNIPNNSNHKRKEKQRLFREEQAKSAHYSFDSSVSDSIYDQTNTRQETRDGTSVTGMYSYSDGFFKRTVYYKADQDGYRVEKEEVEPIGDGPQFNPDGRADVSSSLIGSYSVTADDFRKDPRLEFNNNQRI